MKEFDTDTTLNIKVEGTVKVKKDRRKRPVASKYG